MKIDFVVTWVDSNDPEWQKSYSHYKGREFNPDARYRNWDLFRYWFRAVEKYAPWVNKVFLVTCGHYPSWLNLNHPKLRLVRHEEYIPKEYLPTFRSDTIEFNLHRIPDLSEHFVLFNDDMFLNRMVSPDSFFRDGMPCDAPYEKIRTLEYHPEDKWSIKMNEMCNVAILNRHFCHAEVIKGNFRKWYSVRFPKMSMRERLFYLFEQLLIIKSNKFYGFITPHFEKSFLKSSFDDAWSKEFALLDEACRCRFRRNDTLSIYYIRYWQLATNKFYPTNVLLHGRVLTLADDFNETKARQIICRENIRSICLNDSPRCSYKSFLLIKEVLLDLFGAKFPASSSYELS